MKNRLKKIANYEMEDLGNDNMTTFILNQTIPQSGEDNVVEEGGCIFRKMMNDSTKYVVEVWKLVGGHYAVFSGTADGNWVVGDIEMHGEFNSESEAMNYVQQNLQSKADSYEPLATPESDSEQKEASRKFRLKKLSSKSDFKEKEIAKMFVKKKDQR